MCGLFGLVRPDGAAIDLEELRRATRALRSRGPDDAGYLLVDTRAGRAVACGDADTAPSLGLPPLEALRGERFDLALGFRRLSVLDVSPAGHQPMGDPEGRRFLVFNGEIYNHLELRDELAARGWRFRSHTDTEVLLAACALDGRAVLPRLVGMFAFALLDLRERRLELVRDPFGIKPLFWARPEGGFAFASELRALFELRGVQRRAHPRSAYDYLRFGLTDHGEATLVDGVQQLPPAHRLELRLGEATHALPEPRPEAWWRLAPEPRLDLSFDAAAEHLRELFLESVRIHLRSDVPVGAALSGGIDSSAVVLAMREVQGGPIEQHTFSYVADEPSLDEERFVDAVAARAGAAVHKVRLGAEDLLADLGALVAAQQEPFGSTSIYAQYRVMRCAHEAGVKVMLDGQGADELLAGYRSYLGPRLASLVRRGRLGAAASFLRHASGLPGVRARDVLLRAGARLLPAAAGPLARRLAGEPLVPGWLEPRWLAERDVHPSDPWEPGGGPDALREQLRQAVVRASLPMLLRYEDRNAMAFSVESRVPFLTPALAEFALSLPEEHWIAPDGTSKAVFRRAMRGIVPDAILARRDKIGFATPEHRWLGALTRVAEPFFGDPEWEERLPLLAWPRVRSEWHAIREGRAAFDFRAWRWLNLALWAQRFEVRFD